MEPIMNLKEWASVPENRQNELIVKWQEEGKWWDYEDMALLAARELRHELVSIPEVTNVNLGGQQIGTAHGVIPVMALILNVCTLMPRPHVLKGVPSNFSGFRVEQVNLGPERDAFINTWKCLLRELKGWDESKTLKWAERYADALAGGPLCTAIYDRGPLKLAFSAIVDDEVRRNEALRGHDSSRLNNEMLSILRDATRLAGSTEFNHPDKAEGLNWDSVRKKIGDLLHAVEGAISEDKESRG
jgi:hypothetical protein